MIRIVLDLISCLSLLGSAVRVIPLPGIPVAIHPVVRGIAAVCADPSVVCIADTGHTVDVLPCKVSEPRDICLWNGELAVSDFAGESIVMRDRVIPLRGRPDGICEVLWDTSSAPALAVALFDPGMVALVEEDGTVSTLVKLRIACAEGGAGWWGNPGGTYDRWEFHPIDESLSGPKDIWCRGDSIVIASLFSDVFVSFLPGAPLPAGFICCCISDEGDLVLGHRLGFLVQSAPVTPAPPSPEQP